jgi:putative thiamine transport system ATP-binding protein
VGDNLAFGLKPGGGRAERRRRVEEALAAAALAGLASRDPATLSGGQRARAALLRTLLAEPRALLLDEPFGKLDRSLRGEVRRFVFERARARALPVLLVTHDAEDADAAGGAVIVL